MPSQHAWRNAAAAAKTLLKPLSCRISAEDWARTLFLSDRFGVCVPPLKAPVRLATPLMLPNKDSATLSPAAVVHLLWYLATALLLALAFLSRNLGVGPSTSARATLEAGVKRPVGQPLLLRPPMLNFGEPIFPCKAASQH